VLTTVEFNDFDLFVTALCNDFSRYHTACDQWCANFDRIATYHQNLVELDGLAWGDFNFFQLEGFTLNDTVLLTTAFNHCVHSVLRLISLLAVAINPCKSRGQSQAQTVEFTRDDCNDSQHYPEAGDFTQIRIAEQGLIFL
jgi:hypothetical protein